MLNAYIPEGALSERSESALLGRLTDLLLEHEGADPSDPAARTLAKVWLHRPAVVLHAGEPATEPHYQFIAAVPEGQYDDERRAKMVAAVTEAVLEAEEGQYPRDASRIWVFPTEVQEGTWGSDGRIFGLADIVGLVIGDAEKAAAYARRRLGQRQTGSAKGADAKDLRRATAR